MLRIVLLLGFTLIAALGPVRSDDRRVALVIGVANYRHAPVLANAANDGADMAKALERLGFEVEYLTDADRAAFEAGLRRLGQRARGASASLFYYAGHALELVGRNWLIPSAAELQSERDLRFEAIDLDSVLEQMEGISRLSIVLVDACRDNPFRLRIAAGVRALPSRGLARVSAGAGTFLAFATAPGTVAQDGTGRNSPFTAALLKRIEAPGLELRRLMAEVRSEVRETTQGRQIPWENSALEGDFFFRPAAANATPGPAPTPVPVDREVVFWNSINSSRDPADYRAYLAQYPQGIFAELARNRLAQFQRGLEPVRPDWSDPITPPGPGRPDANQPPPSPPPTLLPTTPLRQALVTRLASAAPRLTPQGREDLAVSYERLSLRKALAVVPGTNRSWRGSGRPTAAQAEERVLESCQAFHGQPCTLVAVDDVVQPEPATGQWPLRDMPRVRYAGTFNPEKIPAMRGGDATRSDVAGFAAASGPKAAAFHPQGRIYTVTGAASSRAAEEQALSTCNVDPDRRGADGPCYLYAVGDQVVLPQRLREPQAPAAGSTAAVPPPAPSPGPRETAPRGPQVPERETVATRLAAAIPDLPAATRETLLHRYEEAKRNKAFAVALQSSGTWRATDWPSPQAAEEKVLEGCQVRYGQPCALVSINDTIAPSRPGGDWPRRSMLRVTYEGNFSPERIPVVPPSVAHRADIVAYGTAASPKAMAIHPRGQLFAVTAAKTQRDAEEQALAACNADPSHMGEDGPCYLYAVSSHVVLPQRHTEPRKPAITISDAMAMVGRRSDANSYTSHKTHKAIAVQPDSGRVAQWWDLATAAYAEQAVLEACQLLYALPCVLVSVDDALRAGDPYNAPRLDMPRLKYSGTFRTAMVPFRLEPEKDKTISSYGKLRGPKAMAIRPIGARIMTATGKTVSEAESKALAACNESGLAFPCFLYAVNENVVLPQRRTEPIR